MGYNEPMRQCRERFCRCTAGTSWLSDPRQDALSPSERLSVAKNTSPRILHRFAQTGWQFPFGSPALPRRKDGMVALRKKKSKKTSDSPAGRVRQAGERESTQSSRNIRETIESIVIAFVLAFLFRTFEAEAFVIPTGSMAPTLQGMHKDVDCPECGYRYQASASVEATDERQRLQLELQRVESETGPASAVPSAGRVGDGGRPTPQ